MVKVLEFGSIKYLPDNWKKGMPREQILNSAMRHLTAMLDGEEIDSESGLPHSAHVACNMMFLSFFEQGLGSEKAMEFYRKDDSLKQYPMTIEEATIAPQGYVWITTEQVQEVKNSNKRFHNFQVYNIETRKYKHKSLMFIADWIIIGLLEHKLRVCISISDYEQYFNPKDTKLRYRAT